MKTKRYGTRAARSALSSLVLSAMLLPAARAELGPNGIVDEILLGQLYPSGNVYVTGFGEEQRKWPGSIEVHVLESGGGATQPAAKGSLAKPIEPGSEDSSFPSDEKAASGLDFIENDFFSTVLDGPVDEPVAMYTTARTGQTYPVIASSATIQLSDFSDAKKGAQRPLTDREKKDVAKQKKAAAAGGCMMSPNFLDSAKVIVTFRIAGTDYRGRLSTYNDPGCAGHLSSIYVLDIIDSGKTRSTSRLVHYKGAI